MSVGGKGGRYLAICVHLCNAMDGMLVIMIHWVTVKYLCGIGHGWGGVHSWDCILVH